MTVGTAVFACSICGEPSSEICTYCTKDACRNHRCDRCKRCSDCCECEEPLSAAEVEAIVPPEASSEAPVANPAGAPVAAPAEPLDAPPAVEVTHTIEEEQAAEDHPHDPASEEGSVP
jgi:hypothetical protein